MLLVTGAGDKHDLHPAAQEHQAPWGCPPRQAGGAFSVSPCQEIRAGLSRQAANTAWGLDDSRSGKAGQHCALIPEERGEQ